MKRPDKYRKRPEFIDVDNAVKSAKMYRGEYVKSLPDHVSMQADVAASLSGRKGGQPYYSMQTGGRSGSADPVGSRNRKSPNPLEENQ